MRRVRLCRTVRKRPGCTGGFTQMHGRCMVMDLTWWEGVATGVLLASLHLFLQHWTARIAARTETHQAFVTVILGGMTLRILLMLGLAALVLALTPVRPAPFVVTLLVLLFGSLLAHMRHAARRLP